MFDRLRNLSYAGKRGLIIAWDFLMLPLALWSAFALRLGELWPRDLDRCRELLIIAPCVTIPIFANMGLYRSAIRYFGSYTVMVVIKSVTLSSLILVIIAFGLDYRFIPRSTVAIYWGTTCFLVVGSRFLIYTLLMRELSVRLHKSPVVIYGAGMFGAQLAKTLQLGTEYDPVAFLDDDRTLKKNRLHGVPIYPPETLGRLIQKHKLTQVLLAMPTIPRAKKQKIVDYLSGFGVHVRTIPTMESIIVGKGVIDELRNIDIEDLLGRDPVPPNETLMSRSILGKNILITGAGGSIGFDLCRQVIQQNPARLIMLDQSEPALYHVEMAMRDLRSKKGLICELIPVLGSVLDAALVERTLLRYHIDTVYHAAAYKHVPMVEFNPLSGLYNNVIGTMTVAISAERANVKRFVLVSTDKAVRPTNVMGASKRLAEMVLQALAGKGSATIFTMVRFGNVLGSSGSVVPLFRRQIRAGGPVTVTHPEITRFFMTIPEAAQLVIQAGSMAESGDVFVLDMGTSVKIVDLAKRMIQLAGHTAQTAEHPEGDIAIEYVGLRPGEKLYEELLIDGSVHETEHERIYRAEENFEPWESLRPGLDTIRNCCLEGKNREALECLIELVDNYTPDLSDRSLTESSMNKTARVAGEYSEEETKV